MTNINMTFSDEDLARIRSEIEQEAKRKAEIKEVYNQLFSKLSLAGKLECFVKIKPWNAMTSNYFKDNQELMTELSIVDTMDFSYYMDKFFIDELKDNFKFIDLNFDNLDLSDEDIELWNKSTMFWFTTGLWIVTSDDTDYIVHEMSGQGETLYFIDTLDEFIVNDPNAKANLSADDLTKFAEQFKEFALKCKN